MELERRTLMRTSAWATPVIATMAPIPVFAASGCAPVTFSAGWTPTLSGRLNDQTGLYGVTGFGGDGVPRFAITRDNASTAIETSTREMAIVHVETTLRLLPERPYTFAVSVASQYANHDPSAGQNHFLIVQALANGVTTDLLRLVKGSNPNTNVGSLASWRQLTTVAQGAHVEKFSFSYTPPAGVTSFTFRYRFLLPARLTIGGVTYSGSNDIGISAPTITGC